MHATFLSKIRLALAVFWLTASPSIAQQQAPFALSIRASHFEIGSEIGNTSFERVKAGSPVQVELSFTNLSNDEIWYVRTNPIRDYAISVADTEGGRVQETAKLQELRSVLAGKTTKVISSSVSASQLKPGETRVEYILLTDFYNMSKPGRYTVQVSKGAVKSNPITIVVTQ